MLHIESSEISDDFLLSTRKSIAFFFSFEKSRHHMASSIVTGSSHTLLLHVSPAPFLAPSSATDKGRQMAEIKKTINTILGFMASSQASSHSCRP